MNIPKSKSVPAIIISDFDSEDPFPKLKSAEARNKIENKIITIVTGPTNSFEEKPQLEIKKPEILPTNKRGGGGEGDKSRALAKTKVGSHFILSNYKFLLLRICPGREVSRMSLQHQSRRAVKSLHPASTKSDPIQNFRKIFKIPSWRKKNYVKLLVKTLFR